MSKIDQNSNLGCLFYNIKAAIGCVPSLIIGAVIAVIFYFVWDPFVEYVLAPIMTLIINIFGFLFAIACNPDPGL